MQAVSVPDRFPLDKARRHHNCGVVLLQLRQPGAAAQHLLLALKYDSADAQAAYLLATMAAEMGRLDEARLLVDLALSIEPQFAPASRLQQRLHEIGPMTEKALTRPGP
jgi:tetratricopeptide (TPR) repeat protein